jgi:penicillin G amidase
MKIHERILFLTILITFAFTTGFDSSDGSRKRSYPQYDSEIITTGLTDKVTVYRDERGMPHIYATNEHDLYFVSGFITAQERLWQMDLIRRSSTGRLSEIFGKSYVKADQFARCLNVSEKSRNILAGEDTLILKCMQAYADGVNSFIKEAGKKLPVEFKILSYTPEPWKPDDIANIIGCLGWNLTSRNLTSELFNYRLVQKFGMEKASQLIPDWNVPANTIYPDFKIDNEVLSQAESFISSYDKISELGIASFSGSNNWAVSGNRTETGKPILSNDMHLSLSSPGIWMQMHQVIPGKLNVTGVLIPGEPFIVAGHNEKIAWGMTNLMVDDVDLFAEKINPDNQNQYFFNGEWKNLVIKDEIINIKGKKRDTLMIKFTHRGPIISEMQNVSDVSLSMRWSGYDPSDEIRSVYLINRAEGWDDFRSGLKSFRTISQNFVYADINGNIGLNAGGGIPIRKGQGTLIRDGKTDEYDWKGYVPFDQLPFSFNPVTGYVSSANNKTAGNDYPYFISSDFVIPYRINRIRQMLEEKEIFGIEDFKKMINDQHSDFARLLTPLILKLNNRQEKLTTNETSTLTALADWDYDMNANLEAPLIFESFRISFKKNLLSDELGELYDGLFYNIGEYYLYRILMAGPDEWVDNINTSAKESIDDIVMNSFKDCISSLVKRCGKNQEEWKWGNVHTVTFEHPLGSVKILDLIFNLNSEEFGIGGSDHTVSPYFSFDPGYKVSYGASERHIFNTSDWDDSYTVLPGGESGIPGSEFYLSQVRTYLDGKFYKDAFSDEAVKASSRYILVFTPGK